MLQVCICTGHPLSSCPIHGQPQASILTTTVPYDALQTSLEPPNKAYAQSIIQQALALWGKPRGVKLGAETQEWLRKMVGIKASQVGKT